VKDNSYDHLNNHTIQHNTILNQITEREGRSDYYQLNEKKKNSGESKGENAGEGNEWKQKSF
jgi:hypothetical protein